MNFIPSREYADFDLFAGAGGASEGFTQAATQLGVPTTDLVAVNHNSVALATHKANHPYARHYCDDVRRICPREATRNKRVRVGIGAPDCGHFSGARGGKPRDAGIRSLAWDVQRWARLTDPDHLLIENVPEFTGWGPLTDDGKVIPSRKGEYFREFLQSLRALGYAVDWRIVRAADYGDPTTRRRLFIQAQRERVVWPEPSHSERPELFGLEPWKTAREIIDWDLPATSIFDRKRPLVDSTMERIWEGIDKYTGDAFLMGIGGPTGRQTVRSLDNPYRTLLTHSHEYVCEPFLVRYNGEKRIQGLDSPITTLDTSNRFALVQAFLVNYYGNGKSLDLDTPLPTITTRDRFALVEVEQRLAQKGLMIADIKLRMLEPHELAKAHSYPETYVFMGNRQEKVAQIGHSWPIKTAKAIFESMLTGEGVPA